MNFRELVYILGCFFFKVVREVPALFAVICLGCIGLGIFFLIAEPAYPKYAIVGKLIGIVFIIFYGWVLCAFLIKWYKGTWKEFCDWCRESLEKYS